MYNLNTFMQTLPDIMKKDLINQYTKLRDNYHGTAISHIMSR